MKYLPLIWAGLWRKRLRTIFTLLSVVTAFLLFGLLQGIDSTFNGLAASGRLDRLVASNPAGLPLPLSYLSQIEAIPGITQVAYSSQLIGYYQNMRNIVVAFSTDPALWFAHYTDWKLSDDQREALIRTKTGVVVTASLAKKLNWKIGDRVPIHGLTETKKDGTSDWYVDIVGIFDIADDLVRTEPLIVMNYGYFDEARGANAGTVQNYSISIADPAKAAEISNTVDNLFANSPNRTRTETEKENAQSKLAQFGDLDFFVDAIVGAAFFTLLLLTGNTMMQSFRERIPEFGVLKTLGFSDLGVVGFVLAESLLLCLAAAFLGLALAWALLPALGSATGGTIPAHLSPMVFAAGVAAALSLALVSGLPPALRAKRLAIVDALAAH